MAKNVDFVKPCDVEHEYTSHQIKELVRCKKDPLYFIENYIYIVSVDKGKILFELYDFQKNLLKHFISNRFSIAMVARQQGKSILVSAYALWFAIFHNDRVIGIASNKEKSAIDFLKKLKNMYELLPVWIKPGVVKWAETAVEFENHSEIKVSATSDSAFRGSTFALLILDEMAFAPRADSFWTSNWPTISSSKTAKVIIISTPQGMFNTFHKLYTGAENGTNAFKCIKYDWTAHPDRDDEWAKEQLGVLGKLKFAQEMMVNFIGSSNTVIDSNVLEVLLKRHYPEPETYDLNNKFRVYEKPVPGAMYCLGVDVAKGTGEHYSTIQVLRIDSTKPIKMKQVAVFENNFTDTYTFSEIVNRTCYYYNNAHIMCENNGEGAPVVMKLWWDYENPNLINEGSKESKLGIRATGNTKPRAVLLMKKLIEDDSIELVDMETVRQLTDFQDKGHNKFGGANIDDDLVSALYWAIFLLEMDILDEKFEFKANELTEDDGWGLLTDFIDGRDDDWSWLTKN